MGVNASFAIPVSPGPGAALDTTGFSANKTIIVSSDDLESEITLEGTQDATGLTGYAPVLGVQGNAEVDFRGAYAFMRLNLVRGEPPTSASLAAESTTAGQFATLPLPSAGSGAPVNTIGFGSDQTFTLSGMYTGTVVIEGSNDDVVYEIIASFSTGGSDVRRNIGVFSMTRARHAVGNGTPIVGIGALPEESSGGGIGSVVSADGTVVVTNPGGPAVDLSINAPGVGGSGSFAVPANSAIAPGSNAYAFGSNAQANNLGSMALGGQAISNADSGVTVGPDSTVLAQGGVALGNDAQVLAGSDLSMALGTSSRANNAPDAVAVGVGAEVNAASTVAVGRAAIATGQGAVVVGASAQAQTAGLSQDVVIGNNAQADAGSTNGIAIGGSAIISGSNDAVAIGIGATATAAPNSVALGNAATTAGDGGIAIGSLASAPGNSVVIGQGASGDPGLLEQVIIGVGATATGTSNSVVVVGRLASVVDSGGAIAIGNLSQIGTSDDSIAIGVQANANGAVNGIAIGRSVSVSGQNATAIGFGASASGLDSIGIGGAATGGAAIVLGRTSSADALGSMALGIGCSIAAGHNGSIAMGSGAVTGGANQLVIGSVADPGNTEINSVVVNGSGGLNPIDATNAPVADGDLGLALIANIATVLTPSTLKFGAAGSGPGGIGRAVYIS